MIDTFKNNWPFFAGFFVFLLIGTVLLLTTGKADLILFFNEHRSPLGDSFFYNVNKLGEGIPYIAAVAVLVFVRFRYALLIPVTGILVAIVAFLFKSFFNHSRPSVYFRELGMFDQINLVEGVQLWEKHSFPSGHTMSAFAVFGILALLFNGKKTLGLVFLFMAILAGLARVYLVQHFLQDVYLGAILGVLIALSVYIYQDRFPHNPDHWIDRSFSFKLKKEKSIT